MPAPIQVITHLIPARYFVAILQTLFLAGDIWPIVLANSAALAVIVITSYSIHYTKLYDFIAAAFFYKVEQGELSYNRESRRQLERMIQHSNNASTNWVTRKVGGPQAVQRILKQQYPAIFQEIRITSYNVCYTKLLRSATLRPLRRRSTIG